jgi:hypothetical protein
MGKRSRDKGARRELQTVKLLEGLGLKAQRVPLSGAAGGQFTDDILCRLRTWLFRAEVKARANAEGWQTLKRWMGESDMLFLIEDRTKPLVVLPWSSWETIVDMIPTPELPMGEVGEVPQ